MEKNIFRTKLTKALNIQYPIIQGGLQWLSTGELAAAVSNAGGLGIITARSFEKKELLKEEIRKVKNLTDNPFGVNISMLPQIQPGEMTEEYIETVLDEGVKVVETAGRNPEPYIPKLKQAGIKVIHKVPAIRYAQKAEKAGADAVTIVGFEGGGHPGMDDVTTMILIPKAVRVLKIPVIAAGGIADARGFMAALSLGADGILMGTRFMLTRECWMHPRIKEKLLQATELDTMIIERSILNPRRVIRNKVAIQAQEMEARGVAMEELMSVISGQGGKKAFLEGDVDAGIISCGLVVGLIDCLKTVREVIHEIVEGAKEIHQRLGNILLQ